MRHKGFANDDESEYDDEVVNDTMKECRKGVVDVIVHETVENEAIRSINDEEYQAEVKEFNELVLQKVG